MPSKIRQLEWLNHNSQRRYPLAASAAGIDLSGAFELPSNFLVELTLPIQWSTSISPSNFFLYELASYPTGYSLTVAYNAESGPIPVASTIFARSTHRPYQVYNLTGVGDFSDSHGHIVIARLDQIDKQPSGLFQFSFENGKLETDVIRPHIRGVKSLQVQNASELSEEMTNRIRLIAGQNIKLTPIIVTGEDPIIRIDAIAAEGLTEECVCTEDIGPIRTINSIPPDGNGNFQLYGSSCLEIVPGSHSLELKDVCSEPCCGCTELEVITEALEAFGSKATTLENFLVGLEARVSQMDMVVLGAKLGDRHC